MRLIKTSSRIAMSIVPNDIVFYSDENGLLYRLLKVPIVTYDQYDELEVAACKNKYSPDIIDGEIVENNTEQIWIRIDHIDGNVNNRIWTESDKEWYKGGEWVYPKGTKKEK